MSTSATSRARAAAALLLWALAFVPVTAFGQDDEEDEGLRARVDATVGGRLYFLEDPGNVDGLTAFGETAGFEVHALELIRHSDEAREPVSSTKIRRALAGGDVGRAAAMLGRPYEVRGVVEGGDKRGTEIGFPTANIPVPKVMAWPADAVYAGWCRRENGDVHPCAINLGRRPTFYEHADSSLLEAHLLDFDGDLYGETARVRFSGFLRSERKFDGVDALIAQLRADVEHTRELLD